MSEEFWIGVNSLIITLTFVNIILSAKVRNISAIMAWFVVILSQLNIIALRLSQ